jgi:hypothetical protein
MSDVEVRLARHEHKRPRLAWIVVVGPNRELARRPQHYSRAVIERGAEALAGRCAQHASLVDYDMALMPPECAVADCHRDDKDSGYDLDDSPDRPTLTRHKSHARWTSRPPWNRLGIPRSRKRLQGHRGVELTGGEVLLFMCQLQRFGDGFHCATPFTSRIPALDSGTFRGCQGAGNPFFKEFTKPLRIELDLVHTVSFRKAASR